MNARTSDSQMKGRSWKANSQRVISAGMLALALATALALNVLAPARVAHAAYIEPAGSSSAAYMRTASYIAPDGSSNAAYMRTASYTPSGATSGVARLSRMSRIAPAQNSSGTCLSVVGTGSRAWRGLAAHYTLCPLN